MVTNYIASVFRTDAQQVASEGERAFVGMRFNAANVSEGQVLGYCSRLASGNGIIAPRIEIDTVEVAA